MYMFFEELTFTHQVLLLIAGSSSFILWFYYFYFFTGLKKLQSAKKEVFNQPVSVIIAARNERDNLEKNLPHIFSQKYPKFEVVVINDGSFDGTKGLLEDLSKRFDNLKIVRVELEERYQRGKKFALTMGIKAAKYEHFLFTDADCIPATEHWLSSMVSYFSEKELILGIAPLKVRNTPLGSVINYETFHTAVQYTGYANRGLPYMGVGRNLAYSKDLFFTNKGFASHQHLLSGDDDLFVQHAATKTNVAMNVDKESFMVSAAPSKLSEWIKQKTRHLSTAKEYKTSRKALLGLYSLAQILFYFVIILCFILHPEYWIYTAIFLGSKWLIQWIVMFIPAMILDYKKVAFALPYYDMLYTVYLILFAFIKPFLKPKTWN